MNKAEPLTPYECLALVLAIGQAIESGHKLEAAKIANLAAEPAKLRALMHGPSGAAKEKSAQFEESKHPRADDGKFGSGGHSTEPGSGQGHAQSGLIAKWGGKVSGLVDKVPALGHVKRGISKVLGKIKERLANRYGDKAAGVIMAGGSLGGYGVMFAAVKTLGFAVPVIPDIISIACHVAVAESLRQFGYLKGKSFDAMSDDELKQVRAEVWKEIIEELVGLAKEHQQELEDGLKGEAADDWH